MTTPVNVAVIYYSSTGHMHRIAERLAQAAEKDGADVRLRRARELAPREAIESDDAWKAHVEEIAHIGEATPDDVEWADVVLLGSPTRFGNVAAQLKQFLDTLGPLWSQGKLSNKVYAGFTGAQTLHGGHESTLLALYNTMHHFGGIIASPGYTDPIKFVDGNPYGVSNVSGAENADRPGEAEEEAADHMAHRAISISRALKDGGLET